MRDSFEHLRAALERHGSRIIQRGSDKFDAQCPSHDDHRPSLSVSRGEKGAVVRCHAGCATDTVVAALGMQACELFDDYQPASTPTRPDVTYDYCDLSGVVQYSILRFPGKQFRAKRASDGKWTLEGVTRVPYRWPALQGREEVFITEGEKDADALARIGIPSTTNAFGAGNWSADLSRLLYDTGIRRAVVLPDNDEKGLAHADDVARHCVKAGIETRIVRLSGVDIKGDVSDWLAIEGNTAATLRQLAATAAPVALAIDTEPALDSWTENGLDFERYAEQEPPPMLVQGLLPSEGVALLHGDPRSFKTLIALDIALAVASGTNALTTLPTSGPRRVLYISNEDGQRVTAERLTKLRRARGLPQGVELLEMAVNRIGSLDEPKWQERVYALVEAKRVGLVILDPLRSLTSHVDQGPSELQPFAAFFRQLEKLGCAVLLVHHDTKPSAGVRDARKFAHRVSGGGLFSKCDAPIHAQRLDDENTVIIRPNAWKFADSPQPLEVSLQFSNTGAVLNAKPYTDVGGGLKQKIVQHLSLEPGKNQSDIQRELHKRPAEIASALEQLRIEGVLRLERHGAAKRWYVEQSPNQPEKQAA